MTPAATHFDVIVVGQGLAGTALAWTLRWSGLRVLVIDRNPDVSSSKIAAGLMTPITGQKLVMTWRYPELWPVARSFYRRIEHETESEFFLPRAMIRWFDSEEEISIFQRRLVDDGFQDLAKPVITSESEQWFANEHGRFEMKEGGQLDVRRFLDVSRKAFLRSGGYVETSLDVSREIELMPDTVLIPRLSLSARRVVFCQGVEGVANPWFRDVEFKPAKGEILTLRIPGLIENRVHHRGVWLAPLGNETFKVGSTYEWKHLDNLPTTQGRDEIISRLKKFLRLPFKVVEHQAAIRPIHRNQYPIIGLHPVHFQLGIFNGLGSKGSIQAPYFAQQLTSFLSGNGEVDVEVDVKRKTRWHSYVIDLQSTNHPRTDSCFHVKRTARRSLTEQAQDAVREVVEIGDIVVDATAGNGHDSHFLAERVGSTGTVYSFDIQLAALQRTEKRLSDAGLRNVVLLNHDHADLTVHLPVEASAQVSAVMFNLGYLPGGDKQVVTKTDSTIRGIANAVRLLRFGGILTILAYTGHDGGMNEATAVSEFLQRLPESEFTVYRIEGQLGRGPSPVLILVKRRPSEE